MSPRLWLDGTMIMAYDPNARLLYCNEPGHRILGVLGQGARSKEIAAALPISAHTVRDHLKNIRLKFQADSKCGILSRMMQGLAQAGAVRPDLESTSPLRPVGRIVGRPAASPLAPRARPHDSRPVARYGTGRRAL